MDTVRLDVDDLMVPDLLTALLGREYKYPVNEKEVEKCLDPEKGFGDTEWRSAMIALIQTSILHVVNARETTEIIRSAGESPMPELPPLPFSRVAIESQETTGWRLQAGDDLYWVYAVFISERISGKVWDCVWYWHHEDNREYGNGHEPFVWWTLHAENGQIIVRDTYDRHTLREETPVEGADAMVSFVVELAHVITAKSVPHEEVTYLSRQQRRRWQAKHPYVVTIDKPRIYYVNLAAAGEHEHEDNDSSGGARVYHVRWLVRGHWRHFAAKTAKRTFTKKSTWVHAHVKGPVGAPWKGRPVYVDKGEQ